MVDVLSEGDRVLIVAGKHYHRRGTIVQGVVKGLLRVRLDPIEQVVSVSQMSVQTEPCDGGGG